MSAILKFDFQNREQLRFSEVNYSNYTKRPNFACGNYIFPKTKGNNNKPWTHSTSLNGSSNFSLLGLVYFELLKFILTFHDTFAWTVIS